MARPAGSVSRDCPQLVRSSAPWSDATVGVEGADMDARKRRSLIIGGGAIAAAGTTVLGTAPAHAATSIVVSSLDDSGTGTLRAAIEAANLSPGLDTITFMVDP